MAETYYPIPANPEYQEQIRALQDSDPARATTIFNPLIEKLISNTHFVKLVTEALYSRIEEVAKDAAGAHDASAVKLSDGTSIEDAISTISKDKANLSSPEFTGIPTAPSPSTGNDSNQIATTSFVKSQDYQTAAQVAAAIEATVILGAAYSAAILTSGWVQGAEQVDGSYWYEYSLTLSNVASGDFVLIIPADTVAEAIVKACVRSYADTLDGGIKLYANAVPSGNFNILFTVNKQEG